MNSRRRTYGQKEVDANIIAHWRFDGNMLDSSGNGNHLSHPDRSPNPTTRFEFDVELGRQVIYIPQKTAGFANEGNALVFELVDSGGDFEVTGKVKFDNFDFGMNRINQNHGVIAAGNPTTWSGDRYAFGRHHRTSEVEFINVLPQQRTEVDVGIWYDFTLTKQGNEYRFQLGKFIVVQTTTSHFSGITIGGTTHAWLGNNLHGWLSDVILRQT
jgi:hypothetical protein